MPNIFISDEAHKFLTALTPEKIEKADEVIAWLIERQALIQGVVDGTHKIVPVEPTPEMKQAGDMMMPITGQTWINNGFVHFEPHPPGHKEFVGCEGAYRAMVGVAP